MHLCHNEQRRTCKLELCWYQPWSPLIPALEGYTDNELYSDVIKPICEENEVISIRADQTYGPGHIMADIINQINASKFVIAEITPPNQNVFFEVGYAFAIGKPIIFIAEKGKVLPFDVSGFRVLFYENSIRGKKNIEDGLRKNIAAILTQWKG